MAAISISWRNSRCNEATCVRHVHLPAAALRHRCGRGTGGGAAETISHRADPKFLLPPKARDRVLNDHELAEAWVAAGG